MNIRTNYLTKHPNYTKPKTIKPKGLMLHSIGCAQPSPEGFAKRWNSASMQKGVHAMIDANTGDVWQFLPWTYKAWHCGSGKNGCGNNLYIGVEMCEPSAIKYTTGAKFTITDKAKAQKQVKTAYDSAVELFAYLCKQYKLNPLEKNVIISHNEGNKLGITTNHGDPEHLIEKFGYTMDGFRKDVDKAMHPATTPAPKEAGTFKVKVTATTLNVREKPSALSKKVGAIAKGGVYTIVKEQNGWGLLKSNLGWVNLKYTSVKL